MLFQIIVFHCKIDQLEFRYFYLNLLPPLQFDKFHQNLFFDHIKK